MANASDLIRLSISEDRTVTEYTDTDDEWTALETDLLAECDDSADVSGEGFSGREARGSVDFWGVNEDGDEWRVCIVRPS